MLGSLLGKVIGSKNDRELKRLSFILDEVNDLEPAMMGLSDGELKAKTPYFKERLSPVVRNSTISWWRHLPLPGKRREEPC